MEITPKIMKIKDIILDYSDWDICVALIGEMDSKILIDVLMEIEEPRIDIITEKLKLTK